MYSIGVDIGTSTVSAVAVETETGRQERAYTIPNGSALRSEREWERTQDPWWILRETKKLLDEIFDRYGEIDAVGLTGQMHGVVYLDRLGRPVSPLYTWQDGRGNLPCFGGESVCGLLKRKYGEKTYAGYGLTTHLFQRERDLVPRDAARLCTMPDCFGAALTGRREPLMHSSMAASLGLYDVKQGRFREELLREMGVGTEILPEVSDSFPILGEYRGAPVCAALGDNQASFLGSVDRARESILVNMGTGGQISVLSDACYFGEGVETRPLAERKYLLTGSSLCGGRAYAVLERFFRLCAQGAGVPDPDGYAMMEKWLREEEPGTERLEVDTAFSGTREEPERRGSIGNIGTGNFTPAALTRGVLEGMAGELYGFYQEMKEHVPLSRSRMIASGNGMRKNPALRRIMGEKFSMEVELAPHVEEAAWGAALAGMIAVGKRDLESVLGLGREEKI